MTYARPTTVHAVQQPLGRPVWTGLQVSRGANETRARLSGALQIQAGTPAAESRRVH